MQQQQMVGYNGMGGANNIMDSLKSNMMTMMMTMMSMRKYYLLMIIYNLYQS